MSSSSSTNRSRSGRQVFIAILFNVVFSGFAAAAQPTLALPNGPLNTALVHPNLLLDLSVEYPTAGSAFRGKDYNPNATAGYFDGSYSNKRLYLGYFDSTTCYEYYEKRSEFKPKHGPARATKASYNCDGMSFSGNYMNWASASAIDMLRLGLTGGNRVVDEDGTPGRTRLERAYLRDEMYANPILFPAKGLTATSITKPNDVTPFTTTELYAVSCRNVILFSDKLSDKQDDRNPPYANCDAPLHGDKTKGPPGGSRDKNLGQFTVRVAVCDTIEYYNRKELCFKYPSGTIKPIGDIQRHAHDLHFGVMSYLLDNGPYRYGGVLRAPLDYVGPKKYDDKLAPSINKASEWHEDTGVFIADPLSGPYGKSGVISYTNMFGSAGIYKANDPVSEMYYESLRYLRGIGPTIGVSKSTSPTFGMSTPDMTERFPVLTHWDDPIIADCQRNAIILIADSNTNFDFYVPGNTTNLTIGDGSNRIVDVPRPVDKENLNNALDASVWTDKVGASEASHGLTNLTASLGSQRNGWKNIYPPSDNEQKGAYYVAGLAYWANVSQMRKNKKNIHAKTFVIDVDERGNGSTNNPSRSFTAPRDSQLYLAGKYGGYPPYTDADPAHASPRLDPYLPGSNPQNRKTKCNSYLWDDNGDCDPNNYFLASDGNNFIEAIHTIIQQASVQGESASVASTSGRVVTIGKTQYIYQASAKPDGGWSGDVTRSPVTFNGTSLQIGKPDQQTAAASLSEPDFNTSPPDTSPSRAIYTWNASGTADKRSTVPFTWDDISADQKKKVSPNPANGPGRLAFLRGATNDEYSLKTSNGLFRRRPSIAGQTNVLGDIVNSSPIFVGTPRMDIEEAGYASFYKAHKDRPAAVYVGANDGMVHSFSSDLTKEYFAYVPSQMFENLLELTNKAYTHSNYVDGGIIVSEAKATDGNWKTVLVGGMGGGAQGVYALDVTDPSAFSAKNGALWEFSDGDDPDMGNVFQAPSIAKFRNGTTGGVQQYRYFAVVASGVNNYQSDDNPSSKAPGGALFLLALDKQPEAKWAEGDNYFKFVIPCGKTCIQSPGGLSAPALVTYPDGSVQFAYAGDLQGNLWRFMFNGAKLNEKPTPHLIFTAIGVDTKTFQPITTSPKVVFAPAGGFVVMVGTGKYIEDKDRLTKKQDSFYGIYDEPNNLSYTVKDRSELIERTLAGKETDKLLTVNGVDFTFFNSAVTYKKGKQDPKGWYLDFRLAAISGERSITPALAEFGKIFFNTLLPLNDVCDLRSSGRSYILDALTGLPDGGNGGSTGTRSTVGMLSTPLVFETNQGVQSGPNAIGKSVTPRKYGVANIGSKATAPGSNKTIDLPTGRLSWLEIQNYKDLRN